MTISTTFFFFPLVVGIILASTSNSWFMMWVGLELNLLSFIPLLISSKHYSLSESAIKYFLIQALSSTILIMASIMYNMFYEFMMMLSLMLINMSLLLKLGASPFHFWFPQVMEGLTWTQAFTLLTIQKMAPFMIMSHIFNMQYNHCMIINKISIILSSLIGALSAFNTSSLRKIMTFSSINHISWMLASLLMSDIIWLTYFIMYTFINMPIIFFFEKIKATNLSNLMKPTSTSHKLTLILSINILSLMGVPPLLGFLPKLIVMEMLVKKIMIMILTIMLFSSLITMIYYIRIIIHMLLMMYPFMSFNMTNFFKLSTTLMTMTYINMLSFFLFVIIWFF